MALTDLQLLVDDLAQQLHAPTVLEDHEQRLVAYSSHNGAIDEVRRDSILRRDTSQQVKDWFRQFGIVQATSPLRIPSHPGLGILGRLCAPVRFHGALMGYLFLIDDGQRLNDSDIAAVLEAQRAAALLLYEEERAQRLSARMVGHLLNPAMELRETAARQLVEEGLAADAPHRVVYVRPALLPPTGVQAVISEAMWELGRTRRQAGVLRTHRHDHGVLLVEAPSAGDDTTAHAAAEEARSLLARLMRIRLGSDQGSVRVVAGIGDRQPHLTSAITSYRQAMLAARVAAAVPSVGDVPRWSDLGAFRALAHLPPGEAAEACLDPRLVRLLSADHALLETIETYLDLGCDAKKTSERLHLHRATLYYRLDKARKLTGADLSDGNDRLALHLGFKLARLTGRHPSAGPLGAMGPTSVGTGEGDYPADVARLPPDPRG